MSVSIPTYRRTLVSVPDTRPLARLSWATLLVVIGVATIGLSAQYKFLIPPSPVPVTGQTLVVLLIAAAYGSRLGTATVGAYVLAGAAGLPLFAGWKFGMAVLNGPTGGYLIGFIAAAWIVGELAESGWDRKPWLVIAAMIIGNIVIYACGVVHLSSFIGWRNAWAQGVQLFLVTDILKIALAAGALPIAWRLKERGTPR